MMAAGDDEMHDDDADCGGVELVRKPRLAAAAVVDYDDDDDVVLLPRRPQLLLPLLHEDEPDMAFELYSRSPVRLSSLQLYFMKTL